jgi:hypothetical protein
MPKDERKYHVGRFLAWLINYDDGLVFARDESYRRHEVDVEHDFDTLYDRFCQFEEDEGVAAAERRAEGDW